MITQWLIKKIILFSQKFPLFRARGSYSYSKNIQIMGGLPDKFKRSEIEYQEEASYDIYLKSIDLSELLKDKIVLDFGSGYGGRTVWYARFAKYVEGIEINQTSVNISNEYAAIKNINNVRFTLGEEAKILFGDNYFDVIISLDVLEHVKRPDLILREFQRILKKDGLAIIIFTPYYGMFNHHLNYITLFPALHWFFSPQNLVDAINDLISIYPQFQKLGFTQQPDPKLSYNGKKLCLPTLNGLTIREYKQLIKSLDFEIIELRTTPILTRFPILGSVGERLNNALNCFPGCNELFSHNIVGIFRKR